MPAPVVARQSAHPAAWFATPLACRLLREELHESIPVLTGCYGRSGLYLRCGEFAPADLSGNMLQQILHLHRDDGEPLRGDLVCREDELPVARESLDLIYLLHALETCHDRHALVREVERVLAPDGTLLIVALNPYSPWRLRWNGRAGRPLSFGACRALLRDAGLDVVRHCGLGPLRPWLRADGALAVAGGARRDPWAVWRAGYLVQARKHRPALTPLRPRAVAFEAGMRAG
jgi:SAM-dependent methyltransferase